MFGLQLNTFDRDEAAKSNAAEPYIKSYLWMRMAIGLLGVLLPALLVIVDWLFVDTDRPVRGSMSAYYHSSARDVFVGGLIATGLFLITYMSAKKKTYDYVLSTTGGALVIVVALLPTSRSGKELGVKKFEATGETCERYAGPPLCNGFQKVWGEDVVRDIHQLTASTFVVLLAILCVVFAMREFGYGPEAKALVGPDRNVHAVVAALRARKVKVLAYLWKGLGSSAPAANGAQVGPPRRRVLTYFAAAAIILLSAAWAMFGVGIKVPGIDGKVGSTYVGEFGAFVSFGLAWLTAALDLMPKPLQAVSDKLAGVVDSISGATPPPEPNPAE